MTLNTVTLKWDLTDLIESGLAAALSITPTAQMSDATDHILIPPVARTDTFTGGTGQLPGIVANDNEAILPAGTGYLISVTAVNGQVIVPQFQTQILYANGTDQWLDALVIVPVVVTSYQYLPLPTGTPSAGQAPLATGTGETSAWGPVLVPANNLSDLASSPAALANIGLASYPDQIPALGYGLTAAASSGLDLLYAAIANRNNARVDIPVIGDSITGGYGATAFSAMWVQQANRAIRAAYPTTANGASGGYGFIQAFTSGNIMTWPITEGGSPLPTVEFYKFGIARDICGFGSGTGQNLTWTAPTGTTSVQIPYYDSSSAGSFTYKVGSGNTTTVTNAGSGIEMLTASIPITGGQVLTIAQASGNTYIDGIIHYAGDESSGITFHSCGRPGWDAGTENGPGWNQALYNGISWAQAYANGFPTVPAAIAIMLGTNDSSAGDGNRTAAEFQSDMEGLISTVRGGAAALASVPVLLIAGYGHPASYIDPGGWPAYVAAMRTAAAASSPAHVIDLSYRLTFGNSGPLEYDTWHPSNLGHALVGEMIAAGLRIA